jgi:hypothetical protein
MAQKEGKLCAWVDAEMSYDEEWAKKLGVDTSQLIYSEARSINDMVDVGVALLHAGVDLIVIDSISQMCELYLAQELSKKSASGNKVDGKAAYGEMARKCLFHLTNLYFMREKHTYLICKQGYQEIDGVNCLTPYFPGKDLNIKVPHLYDFVLRLDKFFIQGVGQRQALRCIGSMAELARDRSGRLSEFEPCDLAALFKKATS